MPDHSDIIIEVAEDEITESDLISSYDEESTKVTRVKLDKFLWAARFFKTRALAKAAIERGKVFLNNAVGKPSAEISIGDELYIKQGKFEKHIRVSGLSTRRRSLDEAANLYEEIIDLQKPQPNKVNRQAMPNRTPRRFNGGMQSNPYNSHVMPNDHYSLPYNKYQEEQYQFAQQQQAKRSSRFLRRSVNKEPNYNEYITEDDQS